MQYVEKAIITLLVEAASEKGYALIDVHPNDRSEKISGTLEAPLTAEQAIEHVDAYDAFSVVEFEPNGEGEGFFVLLVPGNGYDLISDYSGSHADADEICMAVADQIPS